MSIRSIRSVRHHPRLVPLAALLVAGALAGAGAVLADGQQAPSPKGAKALFGEGLSETFMPREGSGGAASMDATYKVTEEQLGSLHRKPEFPGIAYSLEVLQAGETNVRTVEDPYRWEFRTGDRIRLRIIPNVAGYAYVMQSKNQDSLVYPATFGSKENFVRAGHECYVPVSGWLRLVDPAEQFTMKVLFRPGTADYPLNRPDPNPALARVALETAVSREWTRQNGAKGMIYESDRSYLDVPASEIAPVDEPESLPKIDRASYVTNYAVRSEIPEKVEEGGDAIAFEILIRQVGR